VEREVQEDSFTGLFVLFGDGWADQTVAAILKIVMGVSEDGPKKGWRVAAVDKSVEKALQVSLLLLHIFNQLKETEDHSVDHAFQDARSVR
jgi:hypothetical protein